MANNCLFEMKITGLPESVEEFLRLIRSEGEYKDDGLGRVSSDFLPHLGGYQIQKEGDEFVSYCGLGDCAWSLKHALLNTPFRNLYAETERLSLVVEAYGSEPGFCFQEHIVVCCGALIESETVDYTEYWLEGASDEQLAAWSKELGISVEEMRANANENGDYTVGGFGDDFGNFEDYDVLLKDALAERNLSSLDSKIADADARRTEPAVDGKEQTQSR